jgi:hypothetical protein
MHEGRAPRTAGLYFALGHSTVVVAATVALASAVAIGLADDESLLRSLGSVVGTSVSAAFLLLIAIAIIGRIGLGFVLPSLSLGAMRGVDFTLIAQGSSAVNFLRQLGGAIGVSATGIFLQWRLAVRGIETVHGQAVDPEARILAFDETFIFLGTLCALALLAAWRMRRRELPSAIPAAQ